MEEVIREYYMEEAIKKGIEQGMEKALRYTIERMLSIGFQAEYIAEFFNVDLKFALEVQQAFQEADKREY
ncbi:MAG: hypothetical protein AAB316_21090 [Bacteroidota bacterium]